MNEHALEQQALDYLNALLARYESLEAVADRMLAESLTPEAFQVWAGKMEIERDAIQLLEQQGRPINARYRASRPQASDAVRQVTGVLASLMQRVLMKIANLEHQSSAWRAALLPRIDEGVKAAQMKSAYGRFA